MLVRFERVNLQGGDPVEIDEMIWVTDRPIPRAGEGVRLTDQPDLVVLSVIHDLAARPEEITLGLVTPEERLALATGVMGSSSEVAPL